MILHFKTRREKTELRTCFYKRIRSLWFTFRAFQKNLFPNFFLVSLQFAAWASSCHWLQRLVTLRFRSNSKQLKRKKIFSDRYFIMILILINFVSCLNLLAFFFFRHHKISSELEKNLLQFVQLLLIFIKAEYVKIIWLVQNILYFCYFVSQNFGPIVKKHI